MSSEISDRSADLPRETGAVVRNGGGSSEVPVHAGDNPTTSISELYERREQREQREAAGTSGEGAGASGEGAAADEDGRGSEVSAVTADESLDAGHPARESGYPTDAGAPYEGVDGHGANAVIDGQVVSDPVTDSDPAPGEGTWGDGDARFAGWPVREPAVAAGDVPCDREGAVDGRETDGSPGFSGRAGELQGEAGTGERDGSERAGPDTRSSADATRQGERREEAGGEKGAEGQEEGREDKPKDLAPVQHPAPDAETDRPAETAAEAVPDQQPDDPRLAAMEARMERMTATVEAMQEKLEASEARNDALEAKLTAAETRIGELEANETARETRAEVGRPVETDEQLEPLGPSHTAEAGEQREELGLGDVAGDDEAPQADLAAYDHRIADRTGQEENREPDSPERAGFDEAGQSTLGLAGTFGLVNPVVGLAMGLDSSRRTYNEMSPDGKYETNRMLGTYVTAVGGMPPETAALALVTAVVLPTLHSRLRGFIDKYRRKD